MPQRSPKREVPGDGAVTPNQFKHIIPFFLHSLAHVFVVRAGQRFANARRGRIADMTPTRS
jgi:hypothetical protein